MKVERPPIVWTPNPEKAARTQLARFAASLGFGMHEYDALHRHSVSDPVNFWREVWTFSGFEGEQGARGMVDSPFMGQRHFFPDGSINVAQNLLHHDPASKAMIQMTETGEVARTLTYGELREEVERIAGWMQARGVKQGDVVATISGNRVEAVVSFIATSMLGAVWTSVSPELSAQAIIDRIGQVNPVVIFVTPHYTYNAKQWSVIDTVCRIEADIDSVREVVLIGDHADTSEVTTRRAKVSTWGDARNAEPCREYRAFPFNAPFLIMYTSGTTGRPKAIIHSGGGVLIKMSAEHRFHTDLESTDVVFWYTNIAWMMFHWLVMGLSTGAAIVLYEDAAVRKTEAGLDLGVLWRIAQNARVSIIGLSPNYLKILERANYVPGKEQDLAALETVFTSGAPMPASLYQWVLDNVSPTVRQVSGAGGTEILGGIVAGSPLHEVRGGEMSCKCLGFAAEIFDERGVPVSEREGELVITQPFPSMPLTFWGEDGDKRYHAAYFDKFAGVWTHGDFAAQTVSGGFVFHGRSDNTIKPGGVRIGTAEIYDAIEATDGLQDAVIFGWPVDGDEQVVLCVQLSDGCALDPTLAASLRDRIRAQTSARHVPARIYQMLDIPKTQNGKRNEAAAKSAALGRDLTRFVSLSNAPCLEAYRKLDGLQGF